MVGVALAGGGTNWSLARGSAAARAMPSRPASTARRARDQPISSAALRLHRALDVDRPHRLCRRSSDRDFNAQSIGGRVEGGYRFAPSFGGLTPYAAMQAQSFHTPTYSETDVTAAASRSPTTRAHRTDTRSELGARFDRALALNANAVLALRARRLGARLGHRSDARRRCSRRCPARASSSTARRRRRTPRSPRPAPSFASQRRLAVRQVRRRVRQPLARPMPAPEPALNLVSRFPGAASKRAQGVPHPSHEPVCARQYSSTQDRAVTSDAAILGDDDR